MLYISSPCCSSARWPLIAVWRGNVCNVLNDERCLPARSPGCCPVVYMSRCSYLVADLKAILNYHAQARPNNSHTRTDVSPCLHQAIHRMKAGVIFQASAS